jgi:hypothetical protein
MDREQFFQAGLTRADHTRVPFPQQQDAQHCALAVNSRGPRRANPGHVCIDVCDFSCCSCVSPCAAVCRIDTHTDTRTHESTQTRHGPLTPCQLGVRAACTCGDQACAHVTPESVARCPDGGRGPQYGPLALADCAACDALGSHQLGCRRPPLMRHPCRRALSTWLLHVGRWWHKAPH